MKILPLMVQKNDLGNYKSGLQTNNTMRPSFGARLDNDLFERKEDIEKTKLIKDLVPLTDSKITAENLRRIQDRFKDDPKSLRILYTTPVTGSLVLPGLKRDFSLPSFDFDFERRKIMHETFKPYPEILKELYFIRNPYSNNCIPAHHLAQVSASSLYEDDGKYENYALMCEAFEAEPELLAKMFLTRDDEQKLPAHYLRRDKAQKVMCDALQSQPKVLAAIYSTQDADGCVPAHYCFRGVMNDVLMSQPEVLAQIYMTRNKNGDTPADILVTELTFRRPDYDAEIFSLQNYYTRFATKKDPIVVEASNAAHKFIEKLALLPDLDINTSIKLLEANNSDSRHDELLELLKMQRNRENKQYPIY